MSESIPVVIRSSTPPPAGRYFNPVDILRVLYQNHALIRSFASREILERNKGAYLGVAWNIANPLLQLAIYTTIFGYLFGTRWERGNLPSHLDFPLVFFVGQTYFHVFAETANRSPTLVTSRPNLVRKVIFPLEILPATIVASSLFYAAVTLAITLVVLLVAGHPIPMSALLAPVIALPLIMLSLGVSWLLAATGVFIRDVRHIVQVLTQLLMFCTPIFYKVDRFAGDKRWIAEIIEANPLSVIVENARRALLWNEPLQWDRLAIITLFSLIIMQFGYYVFMRAKPQMADVH